MKIVVCTMYSPAYQELANLTVPNLDRYADRHDYDVRLIQVEDEKWAYKKHEAFEEMFDEGYGLVAYKDIDSLITNLNVTYESRIDDKCDLFITKDYNEINGGSLIIKNTETSRLINKAILNSKHYFENEQNAINHLMQSPQFNQFVRVIPQYLINAYMYELYTEIGRLEISQGQWVEGAFILHVPALSLDKRLEVLKSVKVIE